MKKRYVFVIIIFLIIGVIVGGFAYKKITSKQTQNSTDNLEINIYGLVNGDNYLMRWIAEWKAEFDSEGRKAVDAINQMKEDISDYDEGGQV